VKAASVAGVDESRSVQQKERLNMELRHLRCFVVLAEELHFTRAAERLHIEQSPLSRTIKELEDDLGALLFDRDRRGTKLTQAGEAFLKDVRCLFIKLDRAKENVRAISSGCRGSLRIAVSDSVVGPKLSAFLAQCREDVPEVEIRVTETTLAEQRHGLRSGHFHVGFAHTPEVGPGIVADPMWSDPIVLAMRSRHPLLAFKEVPLEELKNHSLLMCDSEDFEGFRTELLRLLGGLDVETYVAETVASNDMMFTLVAAGYGVGFTTTARVKGSGHSDIVARPVQIDNAVMTTYLLRQEGGNWPVCLDDFIVRLREVINEQDDDLNTTKS